MNPFCTAVNPAAKTLLKQSRDVHGNTNPLKNIDTTGDGIADEGSLRGSSETVAMRIRSEIQHDAQPVVNSGSLY